MRKLVVANWKMYLTHNESLAWVDNHLEECIAACEQSKTDLVICPSFTELAALVSIEAPRLSWGSQDCGFESKGPYTGDVAASSLSQIGCRYGIIGHSARRIYYAETNQMIAQKAQQLMGVGITPILCIGETAQEREAGKTSIILEQQLFPLVSLLKAFPSQPIYIAYEPIWAVGSDRVPSKESLIETIGWIRHFLSASTPTVPYGILYGGSVKRPETLSLLKAASVNGILLGRAGIDGDLLKQIIQAW